MRIWIVNYYTSPTTTHPRYLQLAKYFMMEGWNVTTFFANYSGEKKTSKFNRYLVNELDFVEVKAPNYAGNGLARMRSIWAFAWSVYRHAKDFEYPDVILHNIHPPFDYPIVWAAKRLKAKYIAEEWDSWPEDFVASGLISAKNPVMRFAYHIEKLFYYNADAVISTLQGTKDHIKQMGWAKGHGGKFDLTNFFYINNGVDLSQFDRDVINYPRNDEDINRNDIFKIVYLGSINGANNVQALIEAAQILQAQSKYIFFIYGDGAKREELERMVVSRHISNVVFKEHRVPFNEVAWIVSQATVNIMNYEKDFGRWGVSSGKMFLYLAAGKPIVCNTDIKYDNVIKDNNLGVCKDIFETQEFAESIRELAEQTEENYNSMCKRVRNCAEKFDYSILAKQEISVIQSLFESKDIDKQ